MLNNGHPRSEHLLALDNAQRTTPSPRSEHLLGNAGPNFDCDCVNGSLHRILVGCCTILADRREYRWVLCHIVYFLELGVDGELPFTV